MKIAELLLKKYDLLFTVIPRLRLKACRGMLDKMRGIQKIRCYFEAQREIS